MNYNFFFRNSVIRIFIVFNHHARCVLQFLALILAFKIKNLNSFIGPFLTKKIIFTKRNMKNLENNLNVIKNLKKEKFELYEKYQSTLPGFEKALDFLKKSNFNDIKADLSENSVEFYDYKKDVIRNYEFIDFNIKMHHFYTSERVYRKIIIYNKLYSLFQLIFEKFFEKKNYRYNKDMFNCHDLLSQFIRSLRKNFTNSLTFDVKNVLKIINTKFFEEVSLEQQNTIILDLIFGLEDAKVLKFDYINYNMKFDVEFENDLIILFNSSLDCLIFGKQPLYQVVCTNNELTENDLVNLINEYNNFSFYEKIKADDILFWYVVVNTTNFISFHSNINNLLYDFFILKKNISLTN